MHYKGYTDYSQLIEESKEVSAIESDKLVVTQNHQQLKPVDLTTFNVMENSTHFLITWGDETSQKSVVIFKAAINEHEQIQGRGTEK